MITISDRLVAAHNLGLPIYDPRLLPVVRTNILFFDHHGWGVIALRDVHNRLLVVWTTDHVQPWRRT